MRSAVQAKLSRANASNSSILAEEGAYNPNDGNLTWALHGRMPAQSREARTPSRTLVVIVPERRRQTCRDEIVMTVTGMAADCSGGPVSAASERGGWPLLESVQRCYGNPHRLRVLKSPLPAY